MKSHPVRTFIVTGIALFMVALDNLIVTNALPDIRTDLGTGLEGLEWTVNAYTLTFAVLLLPAAAVADRYGRRRLFVGGLAVFTAASAAAALAPNIGTLIAARAIQGAGGAVITPLTLTLLAAAVPAARRGIALAAWSVMSGLGVALGPVLGGAVTEYAAWQWIFWINVPVGVVLLVLAPTFLTESRGAPKRLDITGAALISTGLLGIVLGLVRGNEHGWTSAQVLGALGAGGVLVLAFVVHELRSSRPMLPMTMFRSRGFSLVNAITVAMTFGMFGTTFLLIQFLQGVMEMGPLAAGVRSLPWTAMPLIAAPLTAPLISRLGVRYVLAIAMALQAAGLAWMTLLVSPGVGYAELVPGFVLAGVGMGLFFAPIARAVLGFAPPELAGVASGVNNAVRQLGTVLGVAVLGAVFAAQGNMTAPQPFTDGLLPAMWLGVAVVAAGAVAALLIPGDVAVAAGARPAQAARPEPAPESAGTA
ncbi:DHA2 family efflux MFS transporter permease subunit [Actinomadura darangshiensis]|uniref:DHA2 family efflux MFS transporter permease subunit n=1 Tax=Actinomadura darangshiensis TaxID=705336 RepID=A0A4R5BI13_9ACTN|nr:DHA2 family efflux MFS transporter permease subunit [Actinomadura darangshiensis]TDD85385.1 DHA2 family efflux MFS transporter permease subunit [Actinomadura darangshiensis]